MKQRRTRTQRYTEGVQMGRGRCARFTALFMSIVVAISMLGLTNFTTAYAADTAAETVTFANHSYPYGKDMSATSATLVTELEQGTASSVQWYYSSEENGEYQQVEGATSLTYTFSPTVGDQYWYKCRVNGTDTKAVQLLKANS